MPSFRAALSRRWPSITSPPLRTKHGILKPNSRMLAHMRSTAASFLRGLRAYATNLSMGQICISTAGAAGIALTRFFRLPLLGSVVICFMIEFLLR